MGVISTTKRTVQATVILAVLAYAGFYALTKWDTGNDKQATVIVVMHDVRSFVNVVTYINNAQRSVDSLDKDHPRFSDTFWVRPGETIRVWGSIIFGKTSLTCQILIDDKSVGAPAPALSGPAGNCHIWATA